MSTSHHDATTPSAFAEAVGHFAHQVAHNFSLPVPAQPEDQLKSPVGDLLRAVGEMTSLVVDWRTEVHPDDVDGRPDIGVVTNGLLNGHIELKAPGVGARAEGFTGHNRRQWERFKALPNLVFKFLQAYYSPETGDIRSHEIPANPIVESGQDGPD